MKLYLVISNEEYAGNDDKVCVFLSRKKAKLHLEDHELELEDGMVVSSSVKGKYERALGDDDEEEEDEDEDDEEEEEINVNVGDEVYVVVTDEEYGGGEDKICVFHKLENAESYCDDLSSNHDPTILYLKVN
ncbi:Hypothetical protein ORPV_811 [Orpheovirus IHUMI-LCC2]|uniref:Uncharacterized protein n=1 Tax=Orpheovirus IHUMI-LCC2 TaxID=2023057 RepID=A0A2I2L583_9VIRU|nr:Hypothetical protein ORPV_811 [Orpheovirus IHUMI-LCC2]SNW62715.1 Hypothetical protein ORPV_811 [Orpheovirus IHUMI-LCC2]